MVKIKWTPQSLDDIESIANFIARDSNYYAQMFVTKIFDTTNYLELFPESGQIVSELNRKEIREVALGDYRIIYRIRSNIIEILTVYHSARLLNSKKIDSLLSF